MTGSRGVWRGSARPDRSGQIAGEGQGGVAQDRYCPLETAGVIWVVGPLTEHANWVQGVENGDGDAPHTPFLLLVVDGVPPLANPQQRCSEGVGAGVARGR